MDFELKLGLRRCLNSGCVDVLTFHFSSIAKNKEKLKDQGITHVVNCSMGTKFNQIDSDQAYFDDVGIKFHGIKALDIATFKMKPHFDTAATFIDDALKASGKFLYTVNSRCLKVEVQPKLLISQSNFSGSRKFTLRYQ